ncbi:general substrate transporter [Thelonectria olida]|uniref:General substrate transporter n=1 Tax=Thelonectria olida TaxID=1576542 RepID=A0A9P9ARD9_9HYPO|nr:general substrate transporter [Thelonectria olida]
MVFAKLMPNYAAASVALSFSGFLNGFDTGCIGSISHMSQFADSFGKLSSFVLGITVSMIMLTGVVPAIFAGALADRYGRLKVIPSGALLFGVGAVLQGASPNLVQFIIGRALGGLGQGVFLGNVAVYITEIAPLRQRGRLAALPQFMATTGVCIGYFSCYCTASVKSSMAWRLPYIVQVVVSVALALVCLSLPESPRWLMLQGRADEALRSLGLLDFDLAEARRDFLNTVEQQPSLSTWQGFLLLFRRGYRSRTLLALFMLAMAQLSGIDAITYYAPALFRQAGISSDKSSLISSGVASISMLLISIPAFVLADKWGRRTSAISGGLSLSGIMVLMGTLYAAGAVHQTGAARWIIIISVFLFGMIYCATWGIVCKIYASEIQPGNTRAAANSVGMALSFFTNWLVALMTPILLASSAFGAYFLFGGLALFTVAVLLVHMPETRGRSLENIQLEFQRPTVGTVLNRLRPRGVRRRAVAPGEDHEMQPHGDGVGSTSVAAPLGLRVDVA